jgi:PAS domain-containing protein
MYHNEALVDGYSKLFEIDFTRKDGTILPLEIRFNILKSEKSLKPYTFASLRDVSGHRDAKTKLRNSEKLLQNIIDNIPIMIFWSDKNLKYMGANKTFQEYWNIPSLKDIKGKTDKEIGWKIRSVEKINAEARMRLHNGIPLINRDDIMFHNTKGEIFLRRSSIPLRDESNHIYALLGILEDVTERQKLHEKIVDDEARLRTIYDNSSMAIVEVDLSKIKTYLDNLINGGVKNISIYLQEHPESMRECISLIEIVNFNKATIEMFKISSEESLADYFKSADFYDGYFETSQEFFIEGIISLYPGNLRYKAIRKQKLNADEFVWFLESLSIVPGYENTWKRVMINSVDISKRVEIQESLQQTEFELREKVTELQIALDEIKTLNSMLPICANCKKIRDDTGYWEQVETYISKRTDVRFSHGICPECAQELYGDFLDD